MSLHIPLRAATAQRESCSQVYSKLGVEGCYDTKAQK